ncbi:AraC family ligand binding domain-containing protein [Dyadobacter jiangsuensis]|uniref:AraC family ligand binding domain-containing protein n=1 Tax=Dyadobacter jiangsuensis TaxID=1591085 RepID=UPI000D0DF3D3
MIFPHRHSFYQLLYISSGAGRHVIDFEQYDVEQGSIYFVAPRQVHQWLFDHSTQGSGRPF